MKKLPDGLKRHQSAIALLGHLERDQQMRELRDQEEKCWDDNKDYAKCKHYIMHIAESVVYLPKFSKHGTTKCVFPCIE